MIILPWHRGLETADAKLLMSIPWDFLVLKVFPADVDFGISDIRIAVCLQCLPVLDPTMLHSVATVCEQSSCLPWICCPDSRAPSQAADASPQAQHLCKALHFWLSLPQLPEGKTGRPAAILIQGLWLLFLTLVVLLLVFMKHLSRLGQECLQISCFSAAMKFTHNSFMHRSPNPNWTP